ncbi:MAG: ribosome silencing factor [Lachnospiraceae bacterium]|nr:ribosome silencing factor [Lachnospiraceae bacterium]
MNQEQSKELVKKIYDALDGKKAVDIRIIDIRDITVVADYFVIASAANPLQMAALQDAVDEVMFKNGIQSKQVEGNKNSTWLLMDYEDIIVHLFSSEDRIFYDLERIWQDGVQVSPEDL